MRREWEPEELIACWTLVDEDWRLVGNKTGATRLGFSLILKFFELEGRFPRHVGEVPRAAVDYVAGQVKVDLAAFGAYDWSGRSIKGHRAQIRRALGFRECTVGDEDKLAGWLAEEVCPVELGEERLREALLARCRAERLEPPGPSRIGRVLGAARAAFEQAFCTRIVARLPERAVGGLEELVDDRTGDDAQDLAGDHTAVVGGGPGVLTELKEDPGQLGLETLLGEISKLQRGPRDRATGRAARRRLREAGRRLARPGGPLVPLGLPRRAQAGAADPAGGVVLAAHRRADRRAGAAADRPDPQDRRARRAPRGNCWPSCTGCAARRASCSPWPRRP